MEKGQDRNHDEATRIKQLNLDLINSTEKVQDRYHELLLEVQLQGAEKNGGKPIDVPIEIREELFEKARLHPEKPKQLFSVTGRDLERSRKRGGPSTHAGHSGEALDKNS